MMNDHDILHRRQVIYWRMLAALFGQTEQAPNMEQMAGAVAVELGLPPLLLDPHVGIETLLQRYPELEPSFDLAVRPEEPPTATLTRGLVVSKLLLNAFGPNTQGTPITAAQYTQWLHDIAHLERALGLAPGALRGRGAGGAAAGGGGAGAGTGNGFDIPLDELQRVLVEMENDLIKRMALRELLQDNRLAAQ